jgi:hypothetical protein
LTSIIVDRMTNGKAAHELSRLWLNQDHAPRDADRVQMLPRVSRDQRSAHRAAEHARGIEPGGSAGAGQWSGQLRLLELLMGSGRDQSSPCATPAVIEAAINDSMPLGFTGGAREP